MRYRHRFLLALAALLATGCVAAPASLPPPAVKHPISVPGFYRMRVRPGPPGTLIHSQPVLAPAGARAWRILYHSRTATGRDVAVSGVVIAPAAVPTRGRRAVIAWAHGTVGSADTCAPSAQPDITTDIGNVTQLLARGYVIAASDYQGLGTPGPPPLLNGISEARNVLDSVRAAGQIPQAQAGTQVIIDGHSQGGQAALRAAQIAAQYAPRLSIAGVAASAPVSDVPGILASVSARTSYGIGFLALAVAGYGAGNPHADVNTILTREGQLGWPLITDSCEGVFTEFSGLSISQVFARNPLATQPWAGGLRRESVTSIKTAIPILLLQGGQDQTVLPAFTARLARQLCDLGDPVQYRTYRNAAHDTVVSASASDLLTWIAARIAGRPATATCL